MYRVNYYQEEMKKDKTYDEAFCSSVDNGNNKWERYYFYLKEKYDLCYNVESITIDTEDIKKMKFECFSNGLLLKLYLKCANEQILDKYNQVTIVNNSMFTEELIYNIFKAEWLIDERLLKNNSDELERRKNYYKTIIEVSEARQDIKIQFRNKLFEYFIKTYDLIKNNVSENDTSVKVLKLDHVNK